MEEDKKQTIQSKPRTVKAAKLQDLPLRQRKFIKNYKETGKKRDSAIKAGYSEISAHTTANRLLKNEKILSILNSAVEEAEGVIRGLMQSDDEKIALAAAKETLDRTVGKPIQRTESVQVQITVESMLDSE